MSIKLVSSANSTGSPSSVLKIGIVLEQQIVPKISWSEEQKRSFAIAVCLITFIFVISLVFIFFFAHMVVRPIRILNKKMREILQILQLKKGEDVELQMESSSVELH
jgi:type IV secretory pathway TrbL component